MLLVSLALSSSIAAAEQRDWDVLNDKLVALVDEESIVGVAVGIVAHGEQVFARGYGHASLERETAIDTRSVFHWASVSKPFVAIAVMQLVERGELSVDDLLVERLPWFSMNDERYRDITLSQLLSHTSGMPDVDDYEWGNPQTDPGALKRWILDLEDEKLLFAPGADREYSNIGFEILGMVVQETAGMSFEDFMHENIFAALEMNDTSFLVSDIDSALRVTGHTGRLWRRATDAYHYNRRHAPSSTLNTNVSDMSKFAAEMLGDARILAPETIATMWSVAWRDPDDETRTAALGWNVARTWGGILAASHGGHDDGFRSYLYLAPEENVGIFMVSNDETISISQFMRTMLEFVFPEQATSEANK